MRWNFLLGRGDVFLFRVRTGGEGAFFDFKIPFANFVLLLDAIALETANVSLNGVGLVGKIEWKEIGVGEAHYGAAGNLGQRFAVSEIRVAEMRVPIEIVVDRMIDAAQIFAAETVVQHRDAEEILKSGMIRAAAGNVDAQIGA